MHAYERVTEDQTTTLKTLCYSFVNGVWVLQCPTVLFMNKACEMGPLAYTAVSRKVVQKKCLSARDKTKGYCGKL